MSIERFRPDTILDGALRPVLMIEPAFMHYFESLAPDVRYGVLLLLLPFVAYRKRYQPIQQSQIKLLLLIALSFYLWCFIAGNGRYYLAGLMLPGPAIVLAWRSLPGTIYFRLTVLIGACILQLTAIMTVYDTDPWRWSRWSSGPAIGIKLPSDLNRPVAFVTLGSNTHSAFAPHAHRETSWINLRDRNTLDPYTKEKVKNIISNKASFALFAKEKSDAGDNLQPTTATLNNVDRWLSRYPIQLNGHRCVAIDFSSHEMQFGAAKGFWACPVTWHESNNTKDLQNTMPSVVQQAIEAIENRCPKHFPPNTGADIPVPQGWLRSYAGTEMRIFVEDEAVYYAYYLTLAGTRIGTIQQVLQNNFQLTCQRLQGRYRPPWLR